MIEKNEERKIKKGLCMLAFVVAIIGDYAESVCRGF